MIEDYKEAKRLGEKSYRSAVTSGKYPYLPSLEDFTTQESFMGEEPLGVMDIPLSRIAGTKTAGRKNSFANNFMPLLADSSEFAIKWANLYDSQLEDGIREPIKVYEYMSRYYVQEGNKRVSVMKYVGAATISADVIRLLPAKTDDPAVKKYFDYIKFYNSTHITTIYCETDDGYENLCHYYGKALEDSWSDDEIIELRSDFDRFDKVYDAIGKDKIGVNSGDAFLTYLKVYGHETIHFQSQKDLRNDISRILTEFKTNSNDSSVKLMLEPTKASGGNIISHLFSSSPKKIVVGFVYGKSPETSAWTYAHDLGRAYIQDIYGENVIVKTYENAESQFSPSEVLTKAIDEDGCNIIFTTTPYLGAASLKVAVTHPHVKILNCATNSTYSSVRTYYCRMYETKFLLGAIAGALCKSRKIGYIADYPIYSTISNINAFALGARTTNPDARIQLTWTSLKSDVLPEDRLDSDISIISGKDIIVPNHPGKDFGLYKRVGGEISTLAATFCDWGKFYYQILESIKNDAYKNDSDANKDRAINYWWGISAGVTQLICSEKLPIDLVRMINILTEEISWDRYRPFDTELKDNKGNLIQKSDSHMSHSQIMKMNWLLDNIEGTIPTIEDIVDEALNLVLLQGDPKDKAGV